MSKSETFINIAKRLKSVYKISQKSADDILRRYGPEAGNYIQARKAGLVDKAYDLGRGLGNFGEEISGPDAAMSAINRIADDPAYVRGISSKDLLGDIEFKTYFNTYRDAVVDPKTGGLRTGIGITRARVKGEATSTVQPILNEGGIANTVTQKLGVKPFTGNPTGGLIEAALSGNIKGFADILSQQITNQMMLLRRLDLDAAVGMRAAGMPDTRFYGSANDLQRLVADVTGIPQHMVSSAMAVASAGSSPYDELLKIANGIPYIKMQKIGNIEKAVFDIDRALKDGVIQIGGKTGKYTGDPVYTAAQAFVRAINGVDPMMDDFGGLALKTHQYRNMTLNPDLGGISVSDRIAQRLSGGAGTGIDKTQGLIYAASSDWIGSGGIAAAEGLSSAVPQELGWFAQRVSEVALKGNKRRVVSGSFPLAAGDTRDILTGNMRPDINDLIIEGSRVGKKLKQIPGNTGLDPSVAEYAQRYANIGQAPSTLSDDILMLPRSMRTGVNRDIVGAGNALAKSIGPIIQGNRMRSSALATVAALPPAVQLLMDMARRRNTVDTGDVNNQALDRMRYS